MTIGPATCCVDRLTAAGHHLADPRRGARRVGLIAAKFRQWIEDPAVDVVISTGGTGVTGRDVTPEALDAVIEKPIPGFGELFRMLSFQKIGSSTVQSRAAAGVAKGTYLFALPGSPGACRDGWDEDPPGAARHPLPTVQLRRTAAPTARARGGIGAEIRWRDRPATDQGSRRDCRSIAVRVVSCAPQFQTAVCGRHV